MFNEKAVVACLSDLVQIEQSFDPNFEQPDSRLLTSSTGRILSDVHALCTNENLWCVAPEFGYYNYPLWVAGIVLKAGVTVQNNGKYWLVKQTLSAEANILPPIEGDVFEQTSPFNDWLVNLRAQAAIELVSRLTERKKLAEVGKTVLENIRLYDGGGTYTNRVINKGNFVGFEVIMQPNDNLIININQIGIQLDGAKEIPFYIYHSSQAEPLSVININGKGGLSFNWNSVQAMLKSVDYDPQNGHDAGGLFYIGYYQNDLEGVQAINKNFDIYGYPCATCNRYNIEAYGKWSKYVQFKAIKVDQQDFGENKTLFDINEVEYTPSYNWGINLAVSAQCDISTFLCANKHVFANAMAKMWAVKCLQKIGFSTRINAIAADIKNGALAELNTDVKSSSFYSEFLTSLQALDFDFSGYDNKCLPCSNGRPALTYGAI